MGRSNPARQHEHMPQDHCPASACASSCDIAINSISPASLPYLALCIKLSHLCPALALASAATPLPRLTLCIILDRLHSHHQLQLDSLALAARPRVSQHLGIEARMPGSCQWAGSGGGEGPPRSPDAAQPTDEQQDRQLARPDGCTACLALRNVESGGILVAECAGGAHLSEGGGLYSVALAHQVVSVPQILA